MNDTQALSYVQASAAALGVPMDAQRARRVAGHLQRTAALAALLEQAPLAPDDEPAEIYKPKVPGVQDGRP